VTASIARHRRLSLAALAVLALAVAVPLVLAAVATAASPWARAAGFAGTEWVLMARSAGDHDALWLVSPEDGTSTEAGALPGHAGAVAVSPNGFSIAYLPANSAPHIWIADGSTTSTISLLGAGVRRVHGLTWIDDDRLVVSATTRSTASPHADRLYLVTLSVGSVRSFHGLSGTEPFAAPGAGKLAYVRFTAISGGSRPVVRESLKLLTLGGAGAGRTVVSQQYRVVADHRAFSRPQVSADAAWFLTGQTGSDVRVTYALRSRTGLPLLTLFTPAPQAASWDPAGARVAFTGVNDSSGASDACVWVYDIAAGSLVRTPAGLLGDLMLTSLAWSPTGTRMATEASGWDGQTSSQHVFVLPADLTWFTDIGTGRLPVWIRQ